MPKPLPPNPTRRWTNNHPWQRHTGFFYNDQEKRARIKNYAAEATSEAARERRRERDER